jgi:hypothetical protein
VPAILAATALLGILGFLFCAVSTWYLFQQRTELAIRTLRGSYLADLEQSLLEPGSKLAVVEEISALAADLERGKYEDWQAAGILQRLQRLPVIQWGELQAVQAHLRTASASEHRGAAGEDLAASGSAGSQNAQHATQLTRLQRAVELGKVTAFDFEDVLQPARRAQPGSRWGHELAVPLSPAAVDEVVLRARLVADRALVPDQSFEGIRIETIVRREIELGAREGGF